MATGELTVQWRPERNALTTPETYIARYIPRGVVGYEHLAAGYVQKHPTCNQELAEDVMEGMTEEILEQLINGYQVTLKNGFTFRLSFTGRLKHPDDPLDPVEEILQARIYASHPFVERLRQSVTLERLPASEKLPLITSTVDTVRKLDDFLNPIGALRLTGNDLYFDWEDDGGECVLEGTRSGRTVQTRFVQVTAGEVTFLPDIPTQDNPWNNEYRLSISTHYTEHGTLRTGIYGRKLRTPLEVTLGNDPGILTGSAASPYVTVTGGSVAGEEAVRIQVILDLHEGVLLFNLLDMHEDGVEGEAVKMTANGSLTLAGFAGSGLTSLDLTVNDFEALRDMIRNDYSGRLVDVLYVESGG